MTFEDIGDIDGEHEAAIGSHYAAIVDEWDRAARTGVDRRGALALGYYRGACEASKDMASRAAAEHALRRWFDGCSYRIAAGGEADAGASGDDSRPGAGVPVDATDG